MSDANTDEAEVDEVIADERREAQLGAIGDELGEALVGSHIDPGHDLWIRVTIDAWASTAAYLRDGQGCAYFNFLSAIDWLPSPFGRDMDSQVDVTLEGTAPNETAPNEAGEAQSGVAGGDSRFQVFARVNNVAEHWGVIIKADVADDLTVDSWIPTYAGANWHEREVREMYGIEFRGHPDLRNIYLPTDFEGHPLRKDYPLLARHVKPWPGIVDVELLPGEGDDDADEGDAP